MIFKISNKKKTYIRNIEKLSEGLVIFKICLNDRHLQPNYHYFFEDKKKPPFDLSLNTESGTIEYISFFLQDEKIIEKTKYINIVYKNTQISFDISNFGIDNSSSTQFAEFEFQIDSLSSIWLLRKNTNEENVNAYNLNDNTFLLFDVKNNFVGVLLKNLTLSEYNELQLS